MNLPQFRGRQGSNSPSNGLTGIPTNLPYLNIDKPIIRGRECKMALRAYANTDLAAYLQGVKFDIYSVENGRFIGKVSTTSGADGLACATVPCGIEYEIYAMLNANTEISPVEEQSFSGITYSRITRDLETGIHVVATSYPTDNGGPIYRVKSYGSTCPSDLQITKYFSFAVTKTSRCNLAVRTVRTDDSAYPRKLIHVYTKEIEKDDYFHYTSGMSDVDGNVCLVVPCDERYEFHVYPERESTEQIESKHVVRSKGNAQINDDRHPSGVFKRTEIVMTGSYRADVSIVRHTGKNGVCAGHKSYLQLEFNTTSYWSCDVVQPERGHYNSWRVDDSICVGRAKFVTDDASLLPERITAISKLPNGETLGTCTSSTFFAAHLTPLNSSDYQYYNADIQEYDYERFNNGESPFQLRGVPHDGKYHMIDVDISRTYYVLFEFRCPVADISSSDNGTHWSWSANGIFPEVHIQFTGGQCAIRKSAGVVTVDSGNQITFITDPHGVIPSSVEHSYPDSLYGWGLWDLQNEEVYPAQWQLYLRVLESVMHQGLHSVYTYPFVRSTSESDAIKAANNAYINEFLFDFFDEKADIELGNDVVLMTCPADYSSDLALFDSLPDNHGTLDAVDDSFYSESREAWYTRRDGYSNRDVCLTRFRVLAGDPSKLPTQIVAVSSLPDGTYLGTYTTNVVNPATLMGPRNTYYVSLPYNNMYWQKEDLTGMYYVVVEIRCPTSVYSVPYSFTKQGGEDTIVDLNFTYPDDSCSVLASADGFMDIEGVNSMRLNISKIVPGFASGELAAPDWSWDDWTDPFWGYTMQRSRNSAYGYYNPYMRVVDKRYGIRLAESALVTKLTHDFNNPNYPANTGYGGGELALIDCSDGRVDPYLWVTSPP